MKTMTNTLHKRQRGITLIESMVALVIAALGILGILGVQTRTLTDTQTSVRRAQAVRLIEDLGERLSISPNALTDINAYPSNFTNLPAVTSCAANCTPAQLAAYNVASWKQAVQNTLPLGQASIFFAPGEGAGTQPNRRQLGVMISWRENENDPAAAAIFTPDSTGSAGISCPTNRICHLQYIQLNSRCTIYTMGGPGANMYFCASARTDTL